MVVLVIAIVIIIAIAISPNGKSNSTTNENKVKEETVFAADYDKLIKSYRDNEVNADNIYKGKLLQITGRVESINKDFAGGMYIMLYPLYQGAHCSLNDSQEAKAAALKRGSKITVTGRCTGLMVGNVILADCEIIQ